MATTKEFNNENNLSILQIQNETNSVQELLPLLISIFTPLSSTKRNLLFYNCVPANLLFDLGEHFENPDWLNHAIDKDPSLEFINTPWKREHENFHTVNRILGTDTF